MINHYRRLINIKSAVTSAVLMMLFFSGTASAALSGIAPGYPSFIANRAHIDYSNVSGSTFQFEGYNVNTSVFFKEALGTASQRVKMGPDFNVQVNIDASNPANPQVLAGSTIEVYGKVDSFGTGYGLLYSADIKDVFWTTGRSGFIEFVMDGASMSGAACDLDFCTFTDEVLQFKIRGRFNGDWGSDFSKNARSVSTIPLPAAAWLFGSALLGLSGTKLRKQRA